MKNKYKIILIICIIIGICSILVGSIAYYRIVVEGSIKASTGNAVFVLKDENSNVWNNKEINLGKVNPGDSGSFTVTMDASGSTVDMYATLELDRGNLPTNLKFYTTSDHKSELHKYYSFLETTNQTETLTIYWYWNPYIDDIEDSKFINISNLEAKIKVSAVQISEYAVMKNGYSADSEFWNNTYKPYIRTITFGNDLGNLPSNCTSENLCWDISYNSSQNKKVYGYLIDSGLTVSETDSSTSTTIKKPLYNLYVVSEAPIFAPSDCYGLFRDFKNLVQINFNNNFNTSKVTDMSSMFYGCSSITSLDLSSFNTSKATNMWGMFVDCQSLTKLDLSSFNTSKVTNMSYMFQSCSSLTSLDLSSFNTSQVTDMKSMFYNCSSLKTIILSSFNTSKVTNLSGLFMLCSNLENVDLSKFNTSNVTTMNGMFYNCQSLTKLDLSSFNTSSLTSVYGMVSYASGGRVAGIFEGCKKLVSVDLSSFNTSNVTDMSDMFYYCSSLTSLDLSNFDTSKVNNMSYMFSSCNKLQTQINIMNNNIDAYNYSYMFNSAATDPNAKITVNYIAAASTLVDSMIATKSSNSNVVKGTEL